MKRRNPRPLKISMATGTKWCPAENFNLKPGDSIDIPYHGIEGLIKETDGPLGLYFVFYNSTGAEDKIVQVTDSKIVPFTRPEQMNRSVDDEEPIRTPAGSLCRKMNIMHQIPKDQLIPVIPSPVSVHPGKGQFTINAQVVIDISKRTGK